MSIHYEIFQVVEETIQDVVSGMCTASDVVAELTEYNEELPEEQKIVCDISHCFLAVAGLLAHSLPAPYSQVFQSDGYGSVVGEDLGMGPATYLNPTQVKELSTQLAKVDIEKVYRGLSTTQLESLAESGELGQSSGKGVDSQQLFEGVKETFGLLKEFLVTTKAMGRGILFVVTQ